jgi:bifunctional non-homologous end joining protein LigD
MGEREITVGGRTIQLSSLDKVLFPESGITKGNLITYYRRMAATMVPFMEGRPLTMHRFPNGIGASGFYQKEAPDYFPEWIRRVCIAVEEEGGEEQPQIICEERATLVYLANQACITPHIWPSRVDKLHYPDKLIFDLDPSGNDFALVRETALDLQQLLSEVGLVPFVMTTGSKGLHVVVPLKRTAGFDFVRAFARDVAGVLAQRKPDKYTVAMRKRKRGGRIFLDYLRNSFAQNSVTPYAVRARPGAPVATPLEWDEVDDKQLHSQRYTIKNIFRRLGQKEDPWQQMMAQARTLEPARRRLGQRST